MCYQIDTIYIYTCAYAHSHMPKDAKTAIYCLCLMPGPIPWSGSFSPDSQVSVCSSVFSGLISHSYSSPGDIEACMNLRISNHARITICCLVFALFLNPLSTILGPGCQFLVSTLFIYFFISEWQREKWETKRETERDRKIFYPLFEFPNDG